MLTPYIEFQLHRCRYILHKLVHQASPLHIYYQNLTLLLSDAELNVRYQAFLAELQKLNEEMSKANRIRDFDTVRDKAQNGVEKARAARRIASHIDDREVRRNRLKAIEDIIRDLDKLVEITR